MVTEQLHHVRGAGFTGGFGNGGQEFLRMKGLGPHHPQIKGTDQTTPFRRIHAPHGERRSLSATYPRTLQALSADFALGQSGVIWTSTSVMLLWTKTRLSAGSDLASTWN
jgi:hypothetical protein